MNRFATAAICLAIALLTYFQFPGHTWLQQDTQIYTPILEHQRDPTVLRNDPIATQEAHVAFTLYDETARFLRAATGSTFHIVLALEQIAARALGIWGIYLLAGGGATGWFVTLICSLGAYIAGPAVLTIEYEPSPRAIALPLVICAMGLTARGRYIAAGAIAAIAVLYHPPTALPFWAVFSIIAIAGRRWSALLPLAIAAGIFGVAASIDTAPGQTRALFSRVTPLEEQLQRLRAGYVWISTWPVSRILIPIAVFAAAAAAFWRTRLELPREPRWFLLGLAALGIASMPISWLLLEHGKWALLPQAQPMRLLLFGSLAMPFATALAGVTALHKNRRLEAAGWFALAYLLPLSPLDWRRSAVCLVLAAVTTLATRFAPAVALAAFVAIPLLAGVQNYPHLHTPELEQLSSWAHASTPKDAVFVFPDAGRFLDPGIFRSEALRSVYVDWKGGGQINFFCEFAELWWFRWQQTNGRGFNPDDLPRYEGLGITHVVLHPDHRLPRPPLFENARYLVYTASPALQSR
jgi:hypothetical protein